MNILTVENVSKTFYLQNLNKTIHAVEEVSFHLQKGEFVGITGKSGSGKSTILKCVYGTYIPQEGTIIYHSDKFGAIDLTQVSEQMMIDLRKHEIGYVSQFLHTMPRTTAREFVKKAVLEMGHSEDVAEQETEAMLTHFELENELWDSYPATFSGGEKLRLNIARAMVKRPRLLLLDEPTASLDYSSKLKVKEVIEQLIEEGTTMLGIFHDLEFMEDLCNRHYVVNEGKLTMEEKRGLS